MINRNPSEGLHKSSDKKRRFLTAEKKFQIYLEAQNSDQPVGELLRREGLYSTDLARIRQQVIEIELQWGCAHVSAEMLPGQPGIPDQTRLQWGRAHVSAEMPLLLLLLAQARNVAIAIACAFRMTFTFMMSCVLVVAYSFPESYVLRARTGFSASPRRSRVQLSKNIENSKHKTRRVQFCVG